MYVSWTDIEVADLRDGEQKKCRVYLTGLSAEAARGRIDVGLGMVISLNPHNALRSASLEEAEQGGRFTSGPLEAEVRRWERIRDTMPGYSAEFASIPLGSLDDGNYRKMLESMAERAFASLRQVLEELAEQP